MSSFALRLPDSLYAHAKELAQADQASLNQFITVAVAEKVSAMQTTAFFAERSKGAKPGDLAKFLARVPERKPIPGDELPSDALVSAAK